MRPGVSAALGTRLAGKAHLLPWAQTCAHTAQLSGYGHGTCMCPWPGRYIDTVHVTPRHISVHICVTQSEHLTHHVCTDMSLQVTSHIHVSLMHVSHQERAHMPHTAVHVCHRATAHVYSAKRKQTRYLLCLPQYMHDAMHIRDTSLTGSSMRTCITPRVHVTQHVRTRCMRYHLYAQEVQDISYVT